MMTCVYCGACTLFQEGLRGYRPEFVIISDKIDQLWISHKHWESKRKQTSLTLPEYTARRNITADA